jgi:hypothetical protein
MLTPRARSKAAAVLAAAAGLLAAGPASAEVTMTIINRSSQAVTAINSFPIDAEGQPVEDNLGGIIDDVPPGARATFELDGDCGRVLFFVRLEHQGDADDSEIAVDTCKARTLLLSPE